MKQQKSVSMGQVVLIAIVVSLITSLVVLVLGASLTGNAVIGTKVDNGVFNTVDANFYNSFAPQGFSQLASWGLRFNWTVPEGTQGAGKYESILGSSGLIVNSPNVSIALTKVLKIEGLNSAKDRGTTEIQPGFINLDRLNSRIHISGSDIRIFAPGSQGSATLINSKGIDIRRKDSSGKSAWLNYDAYYSEYLTVGRSSGSSPTDFSYTTVKSGSIIFRNGSQQFECAPDSLGNFKCTKI